MTSERCCVLPLTIVRSSSTRLPLLPQCACHPHRGALLRRRRDADGRRGARRAHPTARPGYRDSEKTHFSSSPSRQRHVRQNLGVSCAQRAPREIAPPRAPPVPEAGVDGHIDGVDLSACGGEQLDDGHVRRRSSGHFGGRPSTTSAVQESWAAARNSKINFSPATAGAVSCVNVDNMLNPGRVRKC